MRKTSATKWIAILLLVVRLFSPTACGDAKAHIYPLRSTRRIRRWTDIRINLYI